MTRKELGNFGENLAVRYLIKHNYQIIDRNYRIQLGEVDVVAKDKDEYVFVEVKTRTTDEYGQPQEAVDFYKQQKLMKTAFDYLERYNLDEEFRIDVVAVKIDFNSRNARITHLKDVMGEW